MSISRRSFLRTGTLAGISAAIPLKALASIGSQEWSANPAQKGLTPVPDYPIDALSTFTRNTFYARIGEYFVVKYSPGKTVKIQLGSLTDLIKGTPGRECFSLIFKGRIGSTFLRQHTYSMNNTKIGDFDLFIVPVGRDTMNYYYEAIINRRYP